MEKQLKILLFPVLIILLTACSTKKQQAFQPDGTELKKCTDEMTKLMLHDVTNPPLASRFYAYAFLAGYEVLAQHDTAFHGMAGILNEYPKIPQPVISAYSYQLAAVLAILETAGKMQPSGKLLAEKRKIIIDSCLKNGMNENVVKGSEEYAGQIAKEILKYAKKDGYFKISDYPRYTPVKGEGYWFPTPPAFFGAIEPYFNKVRPFTLDSASVFKPVPPAEYSAEKGSRFFKLMEEVRITGVSLNHEQKNIAAFWDCNPFAMQDEGHLQIGVKKISPGGHWMGIAGIACQQKKLDFNKSLQIHTVLAITLMDAFITCWDEKYRSNRIRPEAAIRKLTDPEWKPMLQTPPFPEYLSGHSVISTASAEVLSQFLGDSVAYTDNVEVPYGLAPRKFQSFRQAAEEAAISRLYGGIHFSDAIQNGQVQGKKVGGNVIKKLKLKRI